MYLKCNSWTVELFEKFKNSVVKFKKGFCFLRKKPHYSLEPSELWKRQCWTIHSLCPPRNFRPMIHLTYRYVPLLWRHETAVFTWTYCIKKRAWKFWRIFWFYKFLCVCSNLLWNAVQLLKMFSLAKQLCIIAGHS